jgi:hypothetical protein
MPGSRTRHDPNRVALAQVVVERSENQLRIGRRPCASSSMPMSRRNSTASSLASLSTVRTTSSPGPRRARLRPHEDLADPPRLPPEGRRRPPRHARHRPTAQPHSHGVTPAAYETSEVQGRRLPTSPTRRILSRDRTRCPQCPASQCRTRSHHRHASFAHGPRQARPAVRIRLQAWPGAPHPRARYRPARQDAAGS